MEVPRFEKLGSSLKRLLFKLCHQIDESGNFHRKKNRKIKYCILPSGIYSTKRSHGAIHRDSESFLNRARGGFYLEFKHITTW